MKHARLAAAAAAIAAALALALTLAAASPGHHRAGASPFGNGGSGVCLPNGGNWQVHPSATAWAQVDWTSRPGGCWIQVKALFKSTNTTGETKYSGPVTALNLWTRAAASNGNEALAGAWYHWRHCDGPGQTGCGSWSSLHRFYP